VKEKHSSEKEDRIYKIDEIEELVGAPQANA